MPKRLDAGCKADLCGDVADGLNQRGGAFFLIVGRQMHEMGDLTIASAAAVGCEFDGVREDQANRPSMRHVQNSAHRVAHRMGHP